MDIYNTNWSEARENNDLAPPDGFLSGEGAGDVKLTFREVMAAMRKDWDLRHPTLTAGGDGDQVTLTPTVAISAYADGQIFAAKLNADLGAAGTDTRTLNVSGRGGKKIYVPTVNGYSQTQKNGGEAKAGQSVFFAYDPTLDSNNGGFCLITPALSTTTVEAIECPLTAEDSKVINTLTPGKPFSFRLPYKFQITDIRASLKVAQTSGTLVNVYVYYIFTGSIPGFITGHGYIVAKDITIDNGELTSVTAAAPFSWGSGGSGGPYQGVPFPDDTEIDVYVAAVGDGTAKGLKVTLYGHKAS